MDYTHTRAAAQQCTHTAPANRKWQQKSDRAVVTEHWHMHEEDKYSTAARNSLNAATQNLKYRLVIFSLSDYLSLFYASCSLLPLSPLLSLAFIHRLICSFKWNADCRSVTLQACKTQSPQCVHTMLWSSCIPATNPILKLFQLHKLTSTRALAYTNTQRGEG